MHVFHRAHSFRRRMHLPAVPSTTRQFLHRSRPRPIKSSTTCATAGKATSDCAAPNFPASESEVSGGRTVKHHISGAQVPQYCIVGRSGASARVVCRLYMHLRPNASLEARGLAVAAAPDLPASCFNLTRWPCRTGIRNGLTGSKKELISLRGIMKY